MQSEVETKNQDSSAELALETASHSYGLLKWIHPPTASALAIGGGVGAYLAFLLFVKFGLVAIILSMIAGVVLGALVGVVLYWLFRLFTVFNS